MAADRPLPLDIRTHFMSAFSARSEAIEKIRRADASGTVSLAKQLELYVAHGEAHLDRIRRMLAARKA